MGDLLSSGPAPMTKAPDLREEWLSLLRQEFTADYMQELGLFLRREKAAGKEIYPPGREFFAALEATPPEKVKVVILGQDPYHGPGQAHGLSFSVRGDQRVPPSLQNIFKELQDDLGCTIPSSGDLTKWADQGCCYSIACCRLKGALRDRIKGKVGSFYRCRDSGYQCPAAADGFFAVGCAGAAQGRGD